ncbi:MAG: hypothetical protein U0800_27475, partial [Isosphaeraceae bacterium]
MNPSRIPAGTLRAYGRWTWLLASAAAVGCGARAENGSPGESDPVKSPRTVVVTTAPVERRSVERSVEVVGSLKGWEQVTIGAKKGGRVLKILRDMGDHVRPGEELVKLDTVDAKLAAEQARTKYLAELVKLGIDPAAAQSSYERFQAEGIINLLLQDHRDLDKLPADQREARQRIDRDIDETPAIKQAVAALDKARQNYNRQKSLMERGQGTPQDFQNAK